MKKIKALVSQTRSAKNNFSYFAEEVKRVHLYVNIARYLTVQDNSEYSLKTGIKGECKNKTS